MFWKELQYKILRLQYGKKWQKLLYFLLRLCYRCSIGWIIKFIDKNRFDKPVSVPREFSQNNKYCVNYYNFWFNTEDKAKKSEYNKVFQKLFSHIAKPINLVSVFGVPERLKRKMAGIKIFFSGENMKHPCHHAWYSYLRVPKNRQKFDLILSFEYLPWENYLRTPLWFYNYILPFLQVGVDKVERDKIIYDRIVNWVNFCNDPNLRLNPARTRSFAMIASHDALGSQTMKQEFCGLRGEITQFCASLAPVDCAGKLFNNTMELLLVYKNNKNAYLQNYKFNICPENSNSLGYVTEKIFDSINAGCIPIYAGSHAQVEPGILNPEAFIYYNRFDSHKAKERIKILLQNEREYHDFVQNPPFLPSAVEQIFAIYQSLMHHLDKITPPPIKSLVIWCLGCLEGNVVKTGKIVAL